MKRDSTIHQVLDFDDILIVPLESNVRPADVSLQTRLTKNITLNAPLISAPRPDVTESAMAIAMARLGGIGVIHHHMPLGRQVEEVRKVKRAEGDVVHNPITVTPEASVAEAVDLMTTYGISGIPVIDPATKKVAGIITRRDLRFYEDYAKPVSELMKKDVVTVRPGTSREEAKKLMHQHRIEKLVVTDAEGRCAGIMTVKDIDARGRHPNAARDAQGRLLAAASVGFGKEAVDRALAMADAGLDVVFIEAAHAHTREVLQTVSLIRQQRSANIQIVAGNVVTAQGARSLIDAGADAVKTGIGGAPSSASRRIAGVGLPQITAVLEAAHECSLADIPIIADGGLSSAPALAKTIAAGAECAVIATFFGGCDEAPGEIIYQEGKPRKVLSRARASADPWAFTAEAEGLPYTGPLRHAAEHLLAGLRAAMASTGGKDIRTFIENALLAKTN